MKLLWFSFSFVNLSFFILKPSSFKISVWVTGHFDFALSLSLLYRIYGLPWAAFYTICNCSFDKTIGVDTVCQKTSCWMIKIICVLVSSWCKQNDVASFTRSYVRDSHNETRRHETYETPVSNHYPLLQTKELFFLSLVWATYITLGADVPAVT